MAARQATRPSSVSDLTVALQVRRVSAARRRTRRLVMLIGTVVLAALLGWLIWLSPLLAVRQVKAEGNSYTPTDIILAAAQVQLGRQVMRTDPDPIIERVQALPAVAGAEVHRSILGTITISVTERTPVFQLQTGTTFSLVDAEGVLFRTGTERVEGLVVAQAASQDQRLLSDIATVVKALPAEIGPRVQLVLAGSIDDIVLNLDADQQLIWGSAQDSTLKAQVAAALLTRPGTRFDVSAPSHPAIR